MLMFGLPSAVRFTALSYTCSCTKFVVALPVAEFVTYSYYHNKATPTLTVDVTELDRHLILW